MRVSRLKYNSGIFLSGNKVTFVTLLLFVVTLFVDVRFAYSQNLLNLKPNSIFYINKGAKVQINGGLSVDNTAALIQSGGGVSSLYLNGNFDVNGTFDKGIGEVVFNGANQSEITSGSTITFNRILINKSNPSDLVIFNTNFSSISDTVNSGSQSFGIGGNWTANISDNFVINSNGNLVVESSSRTHQLNLSKNLIIENGSLNLVNGAGSVTINFVDAGNVAVLGADISGTVDFATVNINKTNVTDTVKISRGFNSPTLSGFIVITKGTLDIDGSSNVAAALFKATSNLITFNSNSVVLLNNVNFTILGQDADVLLDGGVVRVNAGTWNVGNGGTYGNFFYDESASFFQNNGIINVTKSFARVLLNDNAGISLVKSGGVLRVGANRSSLSTRGVFDLGSTNSNITWTGGDIEILKNSTTFTNGDYYVKANNLANGTEGGTLFFTPNSNDNAENSFKINSTAPIFNLTMLNNSGAASPELEQVENNLLVKGGATILGRGYTLSAYKLELQGDLTINSNAGNRFNLKTNTLLFSGSKANQAVTGTVDSLLIHNLHINKTSGTNVSSALPLTINNSIRLIGNNLLKMGDKNIRLRPIASIYANAVDSLLGNIDGLNDKFNQNKHIQFSGLATGGKIIREFPIVYPNGLFYLRFPVGTPISYSGFYISLRGNKITSAVNAEVSLLPVQDQHPDILEPGIALKKYFKVQASGISLEANAYDIKMEYVNSVEIQGDVNTYDYVFFRTTDKWYDNPGEGFGRIQIADGVYAMSVQEVRFNYLDGDWTAGPRSAVEKIYFSIANGPWDSVGTWSRVGYGQAPATSVPSSNLDLVYIGDGKTVTLNDPISELRGVYVQNTGRLNMKANAYIAQAVDGKDTLEIEDGGTLGIGSQDGISEVGPLGNIRSTTRIFSSLGKYAYNGIGNQVTGSGLPNSVSALIIENTGVTDSTITLTKAVEIKDSLVINRGKLDIVTSSCDGEVPNRQLIMRGGELAVSTFPTKYAAPSFVGGTINFAGASSFTVPSNSHPLTPVLQYYNLKLSADLGANSNITFDPTGEIKISNNLNISSLHFNPIPNAQRILVSGSTVNFNGSDAQVIPSGYSTPTAIAYRLNYDNLKISGAGVKTLSNPNDASPSDNYVEISGNLLITAATLNSGNYNMRVRKNLNISPGAIFQAGTGKVLFNTSGNTNLITLNGQELYDLEVEDNSNSGVLQFMDDATINHNFVVNVSKIKTTTQTINIKGDFTQNGILDLGTGNVNFIGTVPQNLVFNGTGTFYNLGVDKPSNNVVVSGTGDIIVTNNITLTQGNIGGRPTHKAIQSDGVIVRPIGVPGHIDGPLRLNFSIGAVANTIFPVGYGSDYNPFEIELTGGGGTEGLLEVNVNTDIVPNDVNSTIIETGIPNGAELSSLQNIPKRWEVTANFAGNNFALGPRKYTANFNYVNADIRNGANTSFFEVTQRNGAVASIAANNGKWLRTNTGIRTGSSVSILDNEILPSDKTQYFYGGSPANLTFYSVADGNWNDNTIWSSASYGSVDIAPRPPGPSDNVRIGDGKKIVLNVNHTVNAGKVVIVEKGGPSNLEGYLNLGTNIISGAGTFTVTSEGTIGIGDPAGITTSGNTGNIRTTTRNYNIGNHNYGNFIYNGTGAQATGNGMPATVKSFVIDKPSGALTYSGGQIIVIRDSLYFKSGAINNSGNIIKLAGNFRINVDNFAWTVAGDAAYVSDVSLSPSALENRDTSVTSGGFFFNGKKDQYVWREGGVDTSVVYFPRFTLGKTAGDVISNTNIQTRELILHSINRRNIDVRRYNKKFIVYASTGSYALVRTLGESEGIASTSSRNNMPNPRMGWVNGRLIRLIDGSNTSGRVFPIGTDERYTPGILKPDGATTGIIEFQAVDGNHTNFNSNQINENTNIQKFWELTRPTGLPYPTFSLANNGAVLGVDIYYTENEPRGGIDPSAYYNMFRYTGSGNNWDSTSAILQVLPRASLKTEGRLRNLGNALFNTPSVSESGNNAIVLMVGQSGKGTERTFYSRQSGNWTDKTTWSSVDFGNATNTYDDYPNLATDIVYIGASSNTNHKVVMNTDSITVSSVEVDSVNGSYGILSIPDENLISTRQYIQKYGAELEVGSAIGLTPVLAGIPGYYFEQTTGNTYNSFNDGTLVWSGTGNWNNISTQDIGFTFNFNGTDYTQVRITDEGYLAFGNSAGRNTTPISNSGTTNLISAFGRDLQGQSGANIRCKTVGTAPNRVFIAQWTNMRPDNNNTSDFDFQIQLSEGSNEIRILYGRMTTNRNTNYDGQVGIKGASNVMIDIQNRTTTNNWTATTTGTTNSATCRIRNGTSAPLGLQFRWYLESEGTGNIQANLIKNLNFLNLDNNRFTYIGTANQVTGSDLPTAVKKLGVNNTGGVGNNTVTLTNPITISDSLKLTQGKLKLTNTDNALFLQGHLENNSEPEALTSFATTNKFIFTSDNSEQKIIGSSDSTVFNMQVLIDKEAGNVKIIDHNVRLNENLTFNTDNKFILSDNKVLTIGATASLLSTNGDFGVGRSIIVSAGANTGRVRKQFATGSNVSRNTTIPIGENSLGVNDVKYNETYFSLNNMTFNADNYVNLDLKVTYPHPKAPTGALNMLRKYWSFSSENIVKGNGTTDVSLMYNDSGIVGNRVNYLPASYRREKPGILPGWSFVLDNPSFAQVDTIARKIVVTGANRIIDFDWLAADPSDFNLGRRFWSIADGKWSQTLTWTNDTVLKYTSTDIAVNTPGYFPGDTVYISGGKTVSYDIQTKNPVKYVYVNENNTLTGELQFESVAGANANKVLSVTKDVLLGTSGKISKSSTGGTSLDTLKIGRNLINNAINVGRGFTTFASATKHTITQFMGPDSSTIDGTGLFSGVGSIIMKKQTATSPLINHSTTFCSGFTTSILANPSIDFLFNVGSYVHNIPAEITVTTDGDGDLLLGSSVRMIVKTGKLILKDGLICGQDAKVLLQNDGIMEVGNAINESLAYESVTEINLSGTSNLKVAGNLKRRYSTSSSSIFLTDNPTLEVMIKGATTDLANRRAGFDIGEAVSTFQMAGGNVIVYRPMGATWDGSQYVKDEDIKIGANDLSSWIQTGLFQIGSTTVNDIVADTNSYNKMNILSTIAFDNLTFEKTYGRYIDFGTGELKVKRDLLIKTDANVSLNGQNLTVGGNFTVAGSGNFKTGTIGTRQVKLNGVNDQIVRIENTNFNNNFLGFWDFIVSKPSGDVYFPSDAVGSDLYVRNSLQFASGNKAKIILQGTHFAKSGISVATPGSVQKFGDGWIVGELRRWLNNGANLYTFPVSANTTSYTPVSIITTGGTGTPGFLNVKPFALDPSPDIPDTLLMDHSTYITRYWDVVPDVTEPFATGVGRTYTITLNWMKGNAPAGDIRNGATYGIFDVYRRNPKLGTPGTWFQHSGSQKTDSTTSAVGLSEFGSFLIGEPAGDTYYSIADGSWLDPSNWSTEGYDGAPASDYPRKVGDFVKIGKGRHITMGDAFNKTLKSVVVESVDGQLGKLSIVDGASVRGLIFQLKDSCTLETNDNFGFTKLNGPSTNIGAVRTTVSRIYGKSRYEYRGGQTMTVGDGLPDEVFTIIVDNFAEVNNQVSLASNTIAVIDTVDINQGRFTLLNKEMNLQGQLVMENNTEIVYGTGKLRVSGTQNQVLRLNTPKSAVYDFIIDKTGGSVKIDGSHPDAKIVVKNDLKFTDTNIVNVDVRTANKMILLDSNATVTKLGGGFIDGKTRVWMPSGSFTKTFPIGITNNYMYARVDGTTNSNDTVKYVDGIVLENPANEPYTGNRLDQTKRLNYYWSLTPLDSTDSEISTRAFDVKFRVPNSLITSVNKTNAVIRRRPLFTEAGAWTERRSDQLTWNNDTATVKLDPVAPKWTGLGEFFIGEKVPRTFYAVADGIWSDNNTWSFAPDGSILVPAGVSPNQDWKLPFEYRTDVRDKVIIQDFNSNPVAVTLNTRPQIAEFTLDGTSKIIILDTTYLSGSPYGATNANFTNGVIENKSARGITADTSMSIFRFAPSLSLSSNLDFIFSGSVAQKFGDAFPLTIRDLTINNNGNAPLNIVETQNGTLNLRDLTFLSGDLRAYSNSSNLRISRNIISNVTLDYTRLTDGSPANAKILFSGSGGAAQRISGTGNLKLSNISMDRGAGNGVVQTQIPIEITSVLDLQEGTNPNQQIFEIADGGSLLVSNNDISVIKDYSASGTLRYIQTTQTGGSLVRTIDANKSYVYPVGSYEHNIFTPGFATFTGESGGSTGLMAVRTSSGTSVVIPDGHKSMSAGAVDYIGRYWAIDGITHTVKGQFSFGYQNSDIKNDENGITTVGHWKGAKEAPTGGWDKIVTGVNVNTNSFVTPPSLTPELLTGDWTIGNYEAFMRIFYSRQTGDWSKDLSWTLSPTHTGPFVGSGVYPEIMGDSVVIGGGTNGVGNHVITLDLPVVDLSGVQVGGDAGKTGTLILEGENQIRGNYFVLKDNSDLHIGSGFGINQIGNDNGNVVAIKVRDFSTKANYYYESGSKQHTGDALPNIVNNLYAINTGTNFMDELLILDKNVSVTTNFEIQQGCMDLGGFKVTAETPGTGNFVLHPNTQIGIGSTNSMKIALNGFLSYTVNPTSTIEFNGSAPQIISDLPSNLNTIGIGNLIVTGGDNKLVNAPMLVLGNLNVKNGSTLTISTGIDSMWIYGNVCNEGSVIDLYGVMNVGGAEP